jgi:hypothetical protein
MLQAEIGRARVTAAESLPTRGHLMPDFTLSSSDGKQVSLYDYRGRSNLLLCFAGRTEDRADSPVLSALAKRYVRSRRQIRRSSLYWQNPSHKQTNLSGRCTFRFRFYPIRICGFTTWSERLARGRSRPPRSTLLTGFCRCQPYGALAPGTVYLTFRMFPPG